MSDVTPKMWLQAHAGRSVLVRAGSPVSRPDRQGSRQKPCRHGRAIRCPSAVIRCSAASSRLAQGAMSFCECPAPRRRRCPRRQACSRLHLRSISPAFRNGLQQPRGSPRLSHNGAAAIGGHKRYLKRWRDSVLPLAWWRNGDAADGKSVNPRFKSGARPPKFSCSVAA